MYKQPRKLFLASSAVLALSAASGASIATEAHVLEIRDAQISSRITTTYALSPHLHSNEIEVSVEDGKTTLQGIVEEDIKSVLAEQIALSVEGVTKVDNQIEVKADYVAPERSQERSFGETIEDATITTAVKSKLMWSRYAEGLSTNVETHTGQVTLRGTASSEMARALAERLALNTRGVVSVDNQLEILDEEPSTEHETSESSDKSMLESAKEGAREAGNSISESSKSMANSAKESSEEAGEFISDSWITTKVKSSYLWSSEVALQDISVTTTNGVVVLSGRVSSAAQHEQAVELAHALRGVQRVDAKALTYE